MRILKVSLRPPDGRPLRGFADVELEPPGLIVRDFRIVRTERGKLIVLFPQTSIKPPGKPAYFRVLVTLPVQMRRSVEKLVIDAYYAALDRSKEEKNGTNSIPQT
jgi:hypothetical protein